MAKSIHCHALGANNSTYTESTREHLDEFVKFDFAVAVFVNLADHSIELFLVGFEAQRLHQGTQLLW